MRRIGHATCWVGLASALLWAGLARAQDAPGIGTQAGTGTVVQPWEVLGDNLLGIYTGPALLYHGAAVALTPPLVLWVDEPVQRELQEDDPRADPYGESANLIGGSLPIVLPLALYGLGALDDDAELTTAAAAAIQAVVVQFASVGALKWLTDRAGPFPDGDPSASRWHGGLLRDSERADDFDFNPFELSGGLRWPSGHTAANFALVSALYGFHPDAHWIALLGYPFALAVGIGMVEADYHWTSDVVAGALIGHVTGWVIGDGFRRRFALRNTRGQRVQAPDAATTLAWPTLEPLGLRVGGRF